MNQEQQNKAEEVANMDKDINQLCCSYNCHFLSVEEYKKPDHYFRSLPVWGPEKVDEHVAWHQAVLDIVSKRLEDRGLFVNSDTFWDNSIFEPAEAPGLAFRKDKATKSFVKVKDNYDLEKDLNASEEIKNLVQDDKFAVALYAALSNVDWFKNGIEWACSWRYAGGIVADLRNKGEDYLHFYCSGNEGYVNEEIAIALAKLDWAFKTYGE